MRSNYLLHQQHVEDLDGECVLSTAWVIESLCLSLEGKHEQIIVFRFSGIDYLLCMQTVMYVDPEDFFVEDGRL